MRHVSRSSIMYCGVRDRSNLDRPARDGRGTRDLPIGNLAEMSGWRQHVDRAAGEHVLRGPPKGCHMRGDAMRVQRLEAFPGFDHDKRIGSELGLVGSATLGVDDRP